MSTAFGMAPQVIGKFIVTCAPDAGRPTRGAFMRVLRNGEGDELVFTLFFPDGTAEQAVIEQIAVVEDELRAVRSLCLSGG